MAGSLLLHNARVLTMDPALPAADAVLVGAGRILAVGTAASLAAAARGAEAGDMDLAGRVLVPAFIDAHMHVLGYAARLVSVDCSPSAVTSIEELKAAIRARAAVLPPGAWLRAGGYDELALAERRHPTRRDLDQAAPENPVRLLHRSGHACVLNSRALTLAGITGATPEPPGGHLERELETGEPSGLLMEMNDLVDAAVPPLSADELRAAVREASRRLLSRGVTFVQDATAGNGPDEWRTIEDFIARGDLGVSVSMMEGLDHLCTLPDQALDGRIRRGPVKIMPRELEHEFHPGPSELAAMLRRLHAAGRTAAIHAVTRNGVETVLRACEHVGPPGHGHRIEHCGVCSQEQARRIAALGLRVVTQPGFLFDNGDLLRARLHDDDMADLYPVRRLLEAGVPVAGSSDAPVVEPDPLAGIRAAVERRPRRGTPLAPEQGVAGIEALALFTREAARVLGVEDERGVIRPGRVADLVVLDQDPTRPEVDWDELRVEMTMSGGRVVWP